MHKILVSACLCGHNCTYKGDNNYMDTKIMRDWINDERIVYVCPEVKGGLGIPRDPAEIVGDRVLTEAGRDVTEQYIKGAEETLALAKREDVLFAILKENSPSCGSNTVYDGTFTGRRRSGEGITAKLLKENGIRVYNELEIMDAYRELDQAEFDDEMFDELMGMRF